MMSVEKTQSGQIARPGYRSIERNKVPLVLSHNVKCDARREDFSLLTRCGALLQVCVDSVD